MVKIYKMKYVIAHYNEDLSWVKGIDACIVSKGVHVPNLGRETSSYLWWVIGNYHELPDRIAFRQGNPTAHKPHFNEEDQKGRPYHWEDLPLKEYADEVGIEIPEKIKYIASAQFQVSKEEILKHPFDFYVRAYEMSLRPQAPWVFERLWSYIWDVEIWSDAIEKEKKPKRESNMVIKCFTTPKYKKIFDKCFSVIKEPDLVEVVYYPDVEKNTFGNEDYNKLCYDKAEMVWKTLCNMKEGQLFLFFDSDVLIFTDFEWFESQIKDNDIVFQRENVCGGLNAGFMLIKNSPEVRELYKRVAEYRDYRYHDQDVLNQLIKLTKLKYDTFRPKDVYTYGFISGSLYEGKPFYVSPDWKVFHANYCVGEPLKLQLIDYVKSKK
jgi:hypothetical protein